MLSICSRAAPFGRIIQYEQSGREKQKMTKKLYVGNLPYTATEDELFSVFGADGRQVSEVAVIMDRDTGRPRGFGFVTMASEEDAKSAIQALDGSSMGGRSLKVNESQDRQRGGGGGGGGRW